MQRSAILWTLAAVSVGAGVFVFITSPREKRSWPKPDFKGIMAVSIRADKNLYSRMEPIVLEVTFQNQSKAPVDTGTSTYPRFRVLTPSSRELPKTDYAKWCEKEEDLEYDMSYSGPRAIVDPIKPGEKYTETYLLNSWVDLTMAGVTEYKPNEQEQLRIQISKFGVTSNEIEVQVSRDCAFRECG